MSFNSKIVAQTKRQTYRHTHIESIAPPESLKLSVKTKCYVVLHSFYCKEMSMFFYVFLMDGAGKKFKEP